MYTHPLRGTRRSGRSFADAASTSCFATAVIAPRPGHPRTYSHGGSVGAVSDTGNLDLAIVIRTRVRAGDPIYGPAAAGLVADSVPVTEYTETVNRARDEGVRCRGGSPRDLPQNRWRGCCGWLSIHPEAIGTIDYIEFAWAEDCGAGRSRIHSAPLAKTDACHGASCSEVTDRWSPEDDLEHVQSGRSRPPRTPADACLRSLRSVVAHLTKQELDIPSLA
jgi:hypothetical protein